MFSPMKSVFVTLLALSSHGSAHMFLATPVRFDQTPQVTAGPLLADGSNYPCQAGSTGTYTVKQLNNYPLGSTQTIAFIGQAVHGGGSGQVVLTYDTEPRPNSVFKVLKSFEGGFVAKDQTGNMGDDAAAPDPYTYTFEVPKDIPAGNATVAVDWFNKIGNKEMYMMCAPVLLTGSGGDKANYDALPDLFTANIGRGCGTQDSSDLVFPDPGSIVERNNGATTKFATPTGPSCQAAGSRPVPTTGSPAAGATSTIAGGNSFATSSVPAAPPVGATAPTGPPPVFSNTLAIPGPATTDVSAPPVSTAAAPPTLITATSTAATSPGSSEGGDSRGTLTGPCTSEGEFNCVDGLHFQQCGSGMWSVAMPVAPGTKCTGGTGGTLNVVRAGKLRFRGKRFEA